MTTEEQLGDEDLRAGDDKGDAGEQGEHQKSENAPKRRKVRVKDTARRPPPSVIPPEQ
jgi:hypothetical protein